MELSVVEQKHWRSGHGNDVASGDVVSGRPIPTVAEHLGPRGSDARLQELSDSLRTSSPPARQSIFAADFFLLFFFLPCSGQCIAIHNDDDSITLSIGMRRHLALGLFSFSFLLTFDTCYPANGFGAGAAE